MARGENPGQVISVETTLTYDPTQDFGHAQAGQDLMLEAISSGQDAGKFRLLTTDGVPAGKFMDLDKNGVASVMIEAKPMIMRQHAAGGVEIGSRVVGAPPVSGVNGHVRGVVEIELDPGTAGNPSDAELVTYSQEIQTYANGRGYCIKVLENIAGGRILVVFPA